ncbi:MAG: hypothetical protein AAF513_10505 [Pseudomonadota bacterium]
MSTAPAPKRAVWPRVLLAGPWTLLVAIIVMAGMATWLPPGPAQVDNMILPLVLFPLIWAVLFFAASLDPDLRRATWISVGVAALNVVLLVLHFAALKG